MQLSETQRAGGMGGGDLHGGKAPSPSYSLPTFTLEALSPIPPTLAAANPE